MRKVRDFDSELKALAEKQEFFRKRTKAGRGDSGDPVSPEEVGLFAQSSGAQAKS